MNVGDHLACLLLATAVTWGSARFAEADDLLDPSVGAIGRIEQLVLPGTELRVKPIKNSDSPIIVRIADSFPHGDAWRYDFEFYGLEPGQYDLGQYLERIDGSSIDDLPDIAVEIRSLLPPGQIEPNPLADLPGPWLGGYRLLAILAAVVWVIGLILILLVGRKKRATALDPSRPQTLADYLRPRIEQALNGQLDSRGHAELERMLIAFWQKRLALENCDPADAMRQIKAHESAGPLVLHLEKWLHDSRREQDVSLNQLLEPYQQIAIDEDSGSPVPNQA